MELSISCTDVSDSGVSEFGSPVGAAGGMLGADECGCVELASDEGGPDELELLGSDEGG